MKPCLGLAAVLLILVAGCGRNDRPRTFNNVAQNLTTGDEHPAPPRVAVALPEGEFVAFQEGPLLNGQQGGKEKAKPARKIKYNADLKLITDEFDKARDDLQRLIAKHDGYEATADVQASPGAPRRGTWKVRLPIDRFDGFRDAARKLAEVESDSVITEDLTDQYYDLEAHLKNLRAEQESWREMLKRTSDKLENMIAVKRELDRVTDDIERKEGKLRLMANLTELTTVSITLRERQKFNPDEGPAVAEKATFGMRAEKTFEDSWAALRRFGEGIALVAIGVAPWLPVILVLGVPAWYVLRRWHRAMPSATAPTAPTSA